MTTKREQVLEAIFSSFSGMATSASATVLRNADAPEQIPAGGYIRMNDGDEGAPVETALGPYTETFRPKIEIEIAVQVPGTSGAPNGAETAMDGLAAQLVALVAGAGNLGGLAVGPVLVEGVTKETVQVQGAKPIKYTRFFLVPEYDVVYPPT